MDDGESANTFYDGSIILSPISDVIGLPVDQVNFLACQFLVISFGPLFRKYLNTHKSSPQISHVVEISFGLLIAYFCFGRQAIHIFVQSILCLVLMKCLKPGLMEKMVLLTAMAYLCIGHTYRLIYDYGGYTLDVTGPLMLNTQKLSTLAFGIKDGHDAKNGKKLSENLHSKVIRKFPSLLEFASYTLSFHGLLCGPFCFYTDYIAFIEGRNYDADEKQTNGGLHEHSNDKIKPFRPSPRKALYNRLLLAAIFGLSTILIAPNYTINVIKDSGFQTHSFLYKVYLIIMVTSIQRQRYYFAWKLGEAGNISAGMGYNTKTNDWDLIDNVNIWKVEFSTSLKVLVDNWNISTTYWLRYVIYERIRNIVPVFMFSAFWHGFYPGYYITFCTGGLFIFTSRLMRSHVRPWFQRSAIRSLAYDAITLSVTRVAVAYLAFPFLVLEIWPTIYIFKNVYFFLHIGATMLSFTIMLLKKVLGSQKAS